MIPFEQLLLFAATVLVLVPTSTAGTASWFARKPAWLGMRRYFMGSAPGAPALPLALERRRLA